MTAQVTEFRARTIIVLLAVCLAGILAASLFYRFSHPQLIVSAMPTGMSQPASQEDMDAGNMGEIGKLMQHVAKNPDDEAALLHLVEGLMAVNQLESAENFVHKALEIKSSPDQHARALYLLALIQHNNGQNEQAAASLEKVLQKGENPSARYSLGILYAYFLNQPEKAAEHLKKGIALENVPQTLHDVMVEELAKLEKKPKNGS